MFSIASTLRSATAGLLLAMATATPSVVRADGFPIPTPTPHPLPNPNVPGLPQPQPPIKFPDLVMVASPAYQPLAGRVAVVRTRLQNLGLAATDRAFDVQTTVSVIHSGAELPYRIYPMRTQRITRGMAPGAWMDLDLVVLAAGRGDTILVEGMVDSSNEIGESNERNNRFSLRIVVR